MYTFWKKWHFRWSWPDFDNFSSRMTFFQQLLMMIWYCNTNGYCTACVIALPNLVSWLEWFFFSHWCCVYYYLFEQLRRILESFDKFLLILHSKWLKYCPILVEISFFQFFSWIHGAYDSFLENVQFPCSECNCGSAALARRTLESCSTHSGRAHWCLWLHWFPRSPY